MQQKLNIKVKDWNLDNGPAVLICCQRDGGWSMDKQEVVLVSKNNQRNTSSYR